MAVERDYAYMTMLEANLKKNKKDIIIKLL